MPKKYSFSFLENDAYMFMSSQIEQASFDLA